MYYFAYGSNMNPERLWDRAVPYSSRHAASITGYRLVFNKVASDHPGKGYANILLDPSSIVEGVLYEVDADDLARLDRFEGCPHHYQRHSMGVARISGEIVQAVVYVAHPDKVRPGLWPDQAYLAHLLAGRDLISPDYVARLAMTPTAEHGDSLLQQNDKWRK